MVDLSQEPDMASSNSSLAAIKSDLIDPFSW
jgi:hypothetical protein